jgi:hypothetical protein
VNSNTLKSNFGAAEGSAVAVSLPRAWLRRRLAFQFGCQAALPTRAGPKRRAAGHRTSIGRAQRLVKALFGELEEATENRDEIDEAIEAERRDEDKGKRRAMMLRAVALPSRSGVIVNLSGALKTLVALERQAFGLDAEVPTGNYTISDRPMSNDEWADRYTTPE